jgi:predicted ATPase
MVGREPHLAALRHCLDTALAGKGQTILVSGEAGIGKSRLVGEAAVSARDRGMHVLTGQCFEPDRTLPYGPWRDLIRNSLLGQPWAGDILTEVAPDLGGLVPGVAGGANANQEPNKHRVDHALARLIDAVAIQSPLFLVIEDVHWSDEASLDLLVQLARRQRRGTVCPVMLVVTFRGDEVSPELGATLTAIDRERLAVDARLGPLPRAEVIAMLRAMGERGRTVGPDLADAIYRLSEGNPFFVEELFRSALAGARGPGQLDETAAGPATASTIPLPRSVSEAVGRRVRRLSDGARETLTIAAVTGRRFEFALLAELSSCEEAQLLGRVKELVAARLVVEESADRFAFRHALVRQAIAEALLDRERRVLHRRVFDTILRIDPGARDHRTVELARHAAGARAWNEVLGFGRRAGEQALGLYAPRAAIDLLTLAIDAAGHLDREPPAALLRGRGAAHETLGHFEAAIADYEAAVSLAHAEGNADEEAEALLALGACWAERDYGKTGAYVRRSLDLARAGGNRALVARALNRLGNWQANTGDPVEALALHNEALAWFEETGDRRGIAETLDLLGMACNHAGDNVAAGDACRRAIPLLREVNDRQTLLNCLGLLAAAMRTMEVAVVVPAPGTEEERLGSVAEALAIARAIESRPSEAYIHCGAAISVSGRRIGEGFVTPDRGGDRSPAMDDLCPLHAGLPVRRIGRSGSSPAPRRDRSGDRPGGQVFVLVAAPVRRVGGGAAARR